MSKKLRLDQLLVEKGLFASREQARRAVMAGDVKVGTQIAAKPSQLLEPDATIALKPTPRYVGRGALKLESGLDHFNINVHGKTALDVGASTGGFTDCLLQRGAAKVYAVDVGHGQLDWISFARTGSRAYRSLRDRCFIHFVDFDFAERVRFAEHEWCHPATDQATV